jgi:hypothetical protein
LTHRHPILTDPAALAAAGWTAAALAVVRRRLRHDGIRATVPRVLPLPDRARVGVDAALHRLHATCLERALIEQRWLAARGHRHDVIIGIDRHRPTDEFHAWLEGVEDHPTHLQLHRLPPPTAP